jgi:hypothetical protein
MFEVLLLAAGLAAAQPPATAADRALLAQTDPFARAPSSSRARMQVRTAGGKSMALEVWRSGDDALVRFLDPRERGKFLLRLPAGTYFIAPGARQPIRLPPTHRLAGAVALDELLGVGLEKSYEITRVSRRDPEGRLVEFELKALTPTAVAYPRLRWVVDERERLPLRADFQLADGRVARVLEWKIWRDRAALAPKTMVIKDVLRQDPPSEVEVLELEERAVPPGLFSLTDPAARIALDK